MISIPSLPDTHLLMSLTNYPGRATENFHCPTRGRSLRPQTIYKLPEHSTRDGDYLFQRGWCQPVKCQSSPKSFPAQLCSLLRQSQHIYPWPLCSLCPFNLAPDPRPCLLIIEQNQPELSCVVLSSGLHCFRLIQGGLFYMCSSPFSVPKWK